MKTYVLYWKLFLAVKCQWHPCPHQAESCQHVNGGDPCSLLSPAEAHLGCWVLFLAPQYKRGVDIQEGVQ